MYLVQCQKNINTSRIQDHHIANSDPRALNLRDSSFKLTVLGPTIFYFSFLANGNEFKIVTFKYFSMNNTENKHVLCIRNLNLASRCKSNTCLPTNEQILSN